MLVPNQRQKSVPIHDFAMNPRNDVPRSVFGMSHGHKTAFSFSYLIPILVEEVLPGDTWKAGITTAARTAVPIVPVQDNWHLEFFSFFVPMRLVWQNAPRFWGEQPNGPSDSISFTIPQYQTTGGVALNSIYDYMGLPTVGQYGGGNLLSVNALPLRSYNLIYNNWFKDENLQDVTTQNSTVATGDGPDGNNYALQKRGKRFDYFTQALPWPQKGTTAVGIGSLAPVKGLGWALPLGANPTAANNIWETDATATTNYTAAAVGTAWATDIRARASTTALATAKPLIYADLSGVSINSLRTSITLQQYLEKDARGGTRYPEFVFNHFGVRSPDARLQRPEFIGGGHANILTSAIPQTSATGLTGGTTPAGNLAATGHVTGKTGFTYSATEHGFILTLVSARADLTYSQGLRKMWSRSTRYDYPVPVLAALGEQSLLNKEIFADGSANDNNVFGYVPRFDEYRHIPSKITGLYRPTSAGNIAYWHSSQLFSSLPSLNSTFITDDAATVTQRNFSAGASSANQQILADFFFDITVARALPAYGVPGLTRL